MRKQRCVRALDAEYLAALCPQAEANVRVDQSVTLPGVMRERKTGMPSRTAFGAMN